MPINILIIEDEFPAQKRLSQLIQTYEPLAQIHPPMESVEAAVSWFQSNSAPDLVFMDVQLADGLSFSIFEQIKIKTPIIFTTAYDQYTLQAFKVNSVDYLLKPIDPKELKAALEKFKAIHQASRSVDIGAIQNMIQQMASPQYKERFIVKVGQQLTYLLVNDIQYFFSDSGLVYAKTCTGKKHNLDYTLDQIEQAVDPKYFFRINRKVITHLEAINKIHTYFNSRLKLELEPCADFEVIVSRDRVNTFKNWLDR